MTQQNKFRPTNFEEYIGQDNIISNLKVFINAANQLNKPLDHIMLYGSSGYGKTSLAYLIASNLKQKIIILNGPSLQKPSDIISPLTSLKENEIIFIDEIHAVSKEVLEVLYPVLEDNKLNIIIGKEYNSKVVNIKIPNFCLICATTEINKIAIPFLNRFPIQFCFKDYSNKNISSILKNTCKKFNINLNNEVLDYISLFCKNNPRVAINILKRINDYIIFDNPKLIDINYIKKTLNKLEIYQYGLNSQEVEYLKILKEYNILGLDSLSQILNINYQTISSNIEPILLKNYLIIKTAKGRKITSRGVDFLNSII